MKKISILGSTGSIGKNAIKVVRHLKDVEIVVLAAKKNIDLVFEQAQEFSPQLIAMYDEDAAKKLQKMLPNIPVFAGKEGLLQAASHPAAQKVLFSMSGNLGIEPCLAAIDEKKEILLANKEILVSAGDLVMKKAREKSVSIIPVDSEHSALFQCLQGEDPKNIKRMIVTASGGPFRKFSDEELQKIKPRDALKHPNWDMGAKVTIDCSTLMNKGLEVIEAYHLFQISLDKIDVIVHPESIIHSMIEYVDGSVIAQMSKPDMIYPIQYALTYPERKETIFSPFDFTKYSKLTFFKPDLQKFSCLSLALSSLKKGKSLPCFMNAANEVLVKRFLEGEITWKEISTKLEKLMSSHEPKDVVDLGQILSIDKEARILAETV